MVLSRLIVILNYGGLRGVRAETSPEPPHMAPGTQRILKIVDEPINLYFYFA